MSSTIGIHDLLPKRSSTTSIDDLPPEMICELFRHLSLKDLVVCPLVNKRWHSIYSGFRVDRLVSIEVYWHSGIWCHPDRRVEQKELCSLSLFRCLSEKPLLSNLKYLTVVSSMDQFDLNKLNQFKQLVHLEFNVPLTKKVNLNLSKLKVLAFRGLAVESLLSIDCPELDVLAYEGKHEDANLLVVKHPETIRKLEANMIGPKLAQFKNVECFMTTEYRAISKATLLSLPKLKELHYNRGVGWTYKAQGSLDRMKRTLCEFMHHIKVFKASGFKFTFGGFQLTATMLDQIHFDVLEIKNGVEHRRVSDEYFYLKNYQLIKPGALDFINYLNYTALMCNGEIPDCFSKKFNRVLAVSAGVVQDENHFLRFLSSLWCLRSLSLYRTNFSQRFYDQLPANARSLRYFELGQDFDQESKKEFVLNLDFIDELPDLITLGIYRFLSFETLASLVRKLGKLENTSFGVLQKESDGFLAKRKFTLLNDGIRGKVWRISEGGKSWIHPTVSENHNEILNFFRPLWSD